MVLMNFDALNFIYNFNSNNIIIFNTCSFHYCFFREQDVILRRCILPNPFDLTAQNNLVVINSEELLRKYLGKQSQHKRQQA